ncbi:MAG TPA: hypothetical protein VJZ76_14745 [Thermoanaerobaculia bacterium]|nr:hypothetical protein [Thermoanaerobaculia bacterium]
MPQSEWSSARRVAFRFAAVYLFLYLFPFPFSAIPGLDKLFAWWDNAWEVIVKWTGLRVFGVTITVLPNGSGDTTFNYVQVFCLVVIAALATLVWTLFDRRTEYVALHHWLRVYVRFYLATAMFGYGAVKVLQSQFPAPSLDRLIQPFGDASPMGLLWTFMGASAAYNIFTGAGEMLGGLLLTTRRTTTLGALVVIAVMSNVTMLNFAYDVPVKLFSTHLLAMAVFLLLPDLRRLANVFVLNRPAEAVELRPQLGERWRRWAPAARTLFVLALVALSVQQARENQNIYKARSPFRGIWNVEEFALDGRVLPPVVGDASRWRRVVFDYPQSLGIQLMTDGRERFRLKLDEPKRTMTLSRGTDPTKKFSLAYAVPAPDVMTIDGRLDGKRVQARLRRAPLPQFLLTSRGFHWINEYPFNR